VEGPGGAGHENRFTPLRVRGRLRCFADGQHGREHRRRTISERGAARPAWLPPTVDALTPSPLRPSERLCGQPAPRWALCTEGSDQGGAEKWPALLAKMERELGSGTTVNASVTGGCRLDLSAGDRASAAMAVGERHWISSPPDLHEEIWQGPGSQLGPGPDEVREVPSMAETTLRRSGSLVPRRGASAPAARRRRACTGCEPPRSDHRPAPASRCAR
jgi:hypothetical protein